MTTNMMTPVSNNTNTDTNTYKIPSIGTDKETGVLLDPGGATKDPSHSDTSYLSSGPSVSDKKVER